MPVDAGTTSHQPDQLIVDLLHLEAVERMLDDFGIVRAALAPDDRDELLGLARLRDLKDADDDPVEVGELLALLREKAAADRGGWVPTIGKNRVVDAVIGDGHKPMSLPDGAVQESGHKPMHVVGGGFSTLGHKPMSLGALGVLGHKPMDGGQPEPAGPDDVPQPLAGHEDAGRGVRVGVVDTPLASTQPGTAEHPLPYRSGHSAFVSSLIQREAPAAELSVEGVLDARTGRADSWDTARAILRLTAAFQPDILNLSLGCFTLSGGPPLVIARAIERLAPRVLVVAAAGNHGALPHLSSGRSRRSACWPAAVPPVVAVGAYGTVDGRPVMPGWSPDLPWVACLAPGVGVVGAYLTGEVDVDGLRQTFQGHARWSGTSFSAALVSGAIAARTIPGSVTPRQALDKLLAEAGEVRPYPLEG
ncbi:S8 family serine peptidase [Microbispora hainanensis]|uniref:S8/S53 family peptidase n=1 Tax=Microbispora hainanensis TaxID=568844 RepID=A0A544YMF5_9ACTN|nr:S8 family serine peptidase [Microbispora hainanensis]TQS17917.1 S8/S53 family peptidase [Microbispora hainanensis]